MGSESFLGRHDIDSVSDAIAKMTRVLFEQSMNELASFGSGEYARKHMITADGAVETPATQVIDLFASTQLSTTAN